MNKRIEPSKLQRKAEMPESEPSLLELIQKGDMPLPELMRHVQQLEQLGELKAACNLYALWINHADAPNKHYALFNYGGMLQAADRPQEAINAYEAAISLKSDFAQPYINLGLLYEKLKNTAQALNSWSRLVSRRYLGSQPTAEFLTIALNHIGRLQENLKNYGAAEEALEQSLLVNPKQPGVIQHWVHIRQKSCNWPVYKTLPGLTLAELRRGTSPLAMLALTEDPAEQLVTSQSFVGRTYTFKEEWLCKDKKYIHERIRVGYVSCDFREHAVGFLLPPMLEGHDREKYELYAYDFTAEENTAHRAKLKKQFDHVRSIHTLDDRKAAELIAADEIDILIDLHGLSSGARPGIFALHPAPQQGTYLGFIGPTGMPWFDFVVADRLVLPEALSMYFTEKPLYVEGSFIPLISHADPSIQRTREELNIPAHAFVMGALGNIYKITPEMFASWMRLLKRIPDSLLWLIDDNEFSTANLKEQVARHGVEQSRVLFTPRTIHTEFCARLKLIDVYLDTYPYNCGSTTNDVVNAGVPMVTMCGKTMVSRMGLSILNAVNSVHNVTYTMAEYENKVVELSLKIKAGKLIPLSVEKRPFQMDKALEKIVAPTALVNAMDRSDTKSWQKLKIHQICYSEETYKTIPRNFIPLDNRTNQRPDWREYWAMRNYLLTNDLDDDTFYGFLSPKFPLKTGLDFEKIDEFTQQHGRDNDVLIFSPFWDLNSLFLNGFLQGDFFHPGLLNCIEKFVVAAEVPIQPAEVVMHADNTAFCNYFIAKKSFWLHWLELGEKLFHLSESTKGDLSALLNQPTPYSEGDLPMKIFVQERLVNILLASKNYKSKAINIFSMGSSVTPLNQFYEQAIVGNSLKLAFSVTGEAQYHDAYLRLKKSIWEITKIDELAKMKFQ